MNQSQCEDCRYMKEIITPKDSRFLMCLRWVESDKYAKYPQQPQTACPGYQVKRMQTELENNTGSD